MRTPLLLIAAIFGSLSACAQTTVAGRIIAQTTQINKDSSYSFRVQTVAVEQVLENKTGINFPKYIQLVAPIGRVLRYNDGSIAVPLLNSNDADMPYCNDQLGLWTLPDANSIIPQKIMNFENENERENENGNNFKLENNDENNNLHNKYEKLVFSPIESFFLQKAHQSFFAVKTPKHGENPIHFATKAHFKAFLKEKNWLLNEKLLEQNDYDYNNYFALAATKGELFPKKMGGLKSINNTPEPESFTFSPVSVIAGSNTILTLKAAKNKDFGRKKGSVYFTNGEMGLCNEHFYTNSCDTADIISWTKTEIKMLVPSNIMSAFYMEHAGTGPLAIETADKKRIYYNHTPLMIPYSLVTESTGKKSKTKERWYFANYHCDRGLTFAIDTTNIYKLVKGHDKKYHDSLITAIGAAIRHWKNLLPGVQMSLLPYFIQAPYNIDKHIRIISFADDGFNPYREMYSSTSFRSFKTAGEASQKNVSVRSNLEINVRPVLVADKIPYWVDTTLTLNKPADKRDFYCTLLHEIGHLLGLQHSLNKHEDGTRDLMAIFGCGAKTPQTANTRPTPKSCEASARQGAAMVFHDSRIIRWSAKQGQVATLGSLSTPSALNIYKHPQTKLVCPNSTAIAAHFEVAPASKTYSYEWQSNIGKRPWAIMTENPKFKGENTPVLSTTPKFTTTDGIGRRFRCLVSYEGCTAYSEPASYNVGIKQNATFRESGIFENIAQPIELPKGSPNDGVFEGLGISGAGGRWFFTPSATPLAGVVRIDYKVRNEQSSYNTLQKGSEYCIASQNIKVLNEKQLTKTLSVYIAATPTKIDIRKGQSIKETIVINGAGNYEKNCFFLAQISDENGYFPLTTSDNLPNIVGMVNNPLFADIPITIKPDLVSSKNYRFRIIQTAPFAISQDNGKDIIIQNSQIVADDTKTNFPFVVPFNK